MGFETGSKTEHKNSKSCPRIQTGFAMSLTGQRRFIQEERGKKGDETYTAVRAVYTERMHIVEPVFGNIA